MNGNWNNNRTFENRYELTRIHDLLLDCVKGSKNKIIIIDVGCSFGKAMKYTQNWLKQNNIDSYTVGIDPSKKVVDEANENLDEFINQDVLDVNEYVEKADVVICSKTAIFVTGEKRYQIIKKCVNFLKTNGVLITDVDCFEKPKLSDELMDCFYLIPPVFYLKNGVKRFRKEYWRRIHFPLRKKIKKMHKDTALNYTDEILAAWNDMSSFDRWNYKFIVYTKQFGNSL